MSATSSLDPTVMLASESAELLRNLEADAPSRVLRERAADLWLYRSRTCALLRLAHEEKSFRFRHPRRSFCAARPDHRPGGAECGGDGATGH